MVSDYISVENAMTNNLKHVSVNLPKHKINAVTGVSGSGKSSFVFDTIASESQRLLNETYSSYIQDRLPNYQKPVVDAMANLPVSLIINQKKIQGNARSTVGTITDIYASLRLLYARLAVPFVGYSMTYSFNNPDGMCQSCKGLGEVSVMNIDQLIGFDQSLNGNAIRFPTFQVGGWRLKRYTESGYFDNDKRLADYSKDELELLLYSPRMKPTHPSKDWHKSADYMGVVPRLLESFVDSENTQYKKEVDRIVERQTCPQCQGARVNEKVLQAQIKGKSIADCCAMPISELRDFIDSIDDKTVSLITHALAKQLASLSTVGLDYLTLNRATATLSGGESQRIKMTKFLNSALSDVLYIFDEPSVGLHPQDIVGIKQILKEINRKGNSVLFVDHDPDMIELADEVINFGEGAGSDGGNVTFQGSYPAFATYYRLEKVSKNNIKELSIKVPKQAITLVTGVAGSGKSTLMRQLFKAAYPQSVSVDQSLPRASRRSNLTTYLGLFNEIKKVFSRAHQVDSAVFSPMGQGACPECKGRGTIKLDLAYLGETEQLCERCHGKRFNNTTLSYTYRGTTISEVLEMTAQEAQKIFSDNAVIMRILDAIVQANLAYIQLGQSLDTLSGGELQRLKIAQMLAGKIAEIMILDEPTTGLLEADVNQLIALMHRLVSAGATLIVLEHNMAVISQADWVIDLGPKGGNQGGKLLFQGYPIDFIECRSSYTAQHLRRYLKWG